MGGTKWVVELDKGLSIGNGLFCMRVGRSKLWNDASVNIDDICGTGIN